MCMHVYMHARGGGEYPKSKKSKKFFLKKFDFFFENYLKSGCTCACTCACAREGGGNTPNLKKNQKFFFSIFIFCWIAHRLQKNPTNKCVSKSKLANSNVRPKIYFLASSMFTMWGSQTLQVGTQINDDNVIFLYLTFEFAIIDLLYFLFLFRKKIFSKFLILYWKHLTDSVRVHTCTHVHFLT